MLLHYTLGTPCFRDYRSSAMSDLWWATFNRVNSGIDS
jgi:hypothetical protein